LTKEERVRYFDSVAGERKKWRRKGAYYHGELERYLRLVVPPGSSVIEIGCGTGELLDALRPSKGLGIDISPGMVDEARKNFPHLRFETGDLEDLRIGETFQYVVLVETIGHVDDIQRALRELHKVCDARTRVILVSYNYLWEPVLKFAEAVGLRMKQPLQHWLPMTDLANLLFLADFEVVRRESKILAPVRVPFLSTFANRVLANLPLIGRLCLNGILVARPMTPRKDPGRISTSVIVPCRNEKGNIGQAAARIPAMGCRTEILFVEGHSGDGTLEECEKVRDARPDREIRVFRQSGEGKGDAVREGFARATGDVLMILDADLTVPPEDLPKFFEALSGGKGEFINGSRLVYQMEDRAMRFLNLLGNKFFSMAFGYLLEQPIRDTLCGTKVLWREDYEKIAAGRSYFGELDPFGDFDLLFGAARLNLKIVEIPVKYRERTYGRTQIRRFRHGWLLLKMTFVAMRRIKFL
jgi:SAM-dependent methyltransferase